LPTGPALQALRSGLKRVQSGEINGDLARHYAGLADMVLSRWLAAVQTLPQIEQRHALQLDEQRRSALVLLQEMGVAKTGEHFAELQTAASPPLQQLLHSLVEHLPAASAEQAARFRALTSLAIATESAVRSEWEAAISAIADHLPPALQAATGAINTAELTRFLRERFPAAAGVTVRTAQRLPGGRSKDTIMVQLDGATSWPPAIVLRVDLGRYGTSVCDEYPLLLALYRAGIAVPEPLWLEPHTELLGGACMATRRMPGIPGGNLWGEGLKASSSLVAEFAQTLARLHSVALPVLLPDAGSERAGPHVAALIDNYERRWREAMPNASVPLELAFHWLREQLPRIDVAAVMVHGDPGFQNMLVEGDRLSCLLDWEFAHAGDPAEDLAYCRPAVERVMPWPQFMQHYYAAGGPPISEPRLEFFEIWRSLRNASLGTRMLRDFIDGAVTGLDSCAVAVNTYPRLEAQLASSLARVLR
jgi:aminoglycoside phosphotransferase (APT) family kinase protein